MFYQRYADDFIIAVMGSKADAERIKSDIGEFLANKLKLTLSPEKTLVTNGHDRAKFLGYEITISDMSTTRRTPQGMCRTKSAKVRLLVPHDKWVGKLKGYEALKIKKQIDGTERWVPLQRNNLIHKEPIEILSRYNAEIRGMYNYYSMANNVSVLNKFFYIMEYSMYKTLCAKYKTKISKIKQRFCKTVNLAWNTILNQEEKELFYTMRDLGTNLSPLNVNRLTIFRNLKTIAAQIHW